MTAPSPRPLLRPGDPGAAELVWLKTGDTRAPLFLFGGAGGKSEELAPLAQRLTDARAAAYVKLLAEGETPSFEEMVDRALALIAAAQPDGACYLLGYSFGGGVAVEVARRLREAGREVADLILIEAVYGRSFWPLRLWLESQVRRALFRLGELRGRPLGEAARQLGYRAGRLVGQAMARFAGGAPVAPDAASQHAPEAKASYAAMARFRPRPYPGPAVYFKAERHEALGCDPAGLWPRLVGDLQVERLPGDHLAIMLHPDVVARLARRVDARLAAAARKPPTALVVTARIWHAPARLALGLWEAGFAVRAVCPAGHVLEKVEFIEAARRLPLLNWKRALRREIEASQPDLLVPADDAAARLVHALHGEAVREGAAGERVRRLVERSLGAGGAYHRLQARAGVAAVAEALGVAGPRTREVKTRAALDRAIAELGLPLMLKTDGSSGGQGVTLARTPAEAHRARTRLAAPPPLVWSLKRLAVNREADRLTDWIRRRRPVVNAQAFVPGRPANAAAALWRGEVLACVCCEAIETLYPDGPASVVRILDHAQMRETVARMARGLELSGFCGFDFILDEAGQAHVIEMNARATPTAHLTDAEGRSPPRALLAALLGEAAETGPGQAGQRIALFPQELIRDPASEHLVLGRHDVPTLSPYLVRRGLRLARRKRRGR